MSSSTSNDCLAISADTAASCADKTLSYISPISPKIDTAISGISVSQPYWSSVSLDLDVETLKRGCEINRFNLTNGGGITKYGQQVIDELNSYVGGTLNPAYSMGRCDLFTSDNRQVMRFMYGFVYPLGSTDAPLYVCAEEHIMSVIQIGKEVIDYFNKVNDLTEQVKSKISILGSFSR